MFPGKRWRSVLGLGLTLWFAGCGGGGGGDNSPPPPPNPLYVRVSGRDTNSGGDPANALQTISKAAQIARGGYTIIVGPGTYLEGVTLTSQGKAPDVVTFLADITGAMTKDPAGAVIINAAGTRAGAAFSLAGTSGTTIDGFTTTGGADAGIVVKSGSNNFMIQNCVVFNNPGDGIQVQDSSNVLIFNNLVYGSGGIGIRVAGQSSGSPDTHIINNTVFGQGSLGVSIGNTTRPSPRAFLRNNIIQNNGGDASIKVFTNPRSDEGYDGDFNLLLPFLYLPSTGIKGDNDFAGDALFVAPGVGNFHLRTNSPAIDHGGALNLPSSKTNILRGRTTTGSGVDSSNTPFDLGYHYPR